MSVTLPEITVVGRPTPFPVSVSDWFAEGFTVGWRDRAQPQEAPAPLNDEALTAFFDGGRLGAESRLEIEEMEFEFDNPDGQPGAEPDLHGKVFEEVEREWNEAWSKFLEHEAPHSEDKQPEIEFAE